MNDEYYMREAIAQAQEASDRGEVPVGAVIVNSKGNIISRAGNSPISLLDPSAHAEILAIREAATILGNYRLLDCSLYVTLEPCTMCAGAISAARLKRVVYGATDVKGGALESGVRFFETKFCNHKPLIQSGILANDSSIILKNFFQIRRKAKKNLD